MTSMPSILFVCQSNGGKSQIAEALARASAGTSLRVYSAGTRPGATLNSEAVAALAEVGIDMTSHTPKGVDPALLSTVDHVVILGDSAQITMPEGARGTVERWDIDEPSTRDIHGAERMALIRDEIREKVAHLLAQLRSA